MRDLKKRESITETVNKDKKEVGDETERAEKVTDDAGHVHDANENIELQGTEEGAKEITKSVSNAMDKTKKVHKDLDKEQDKRFGEIKKIEKNLSERTAETKKDIQSINKEIGNMRSKDATDAKESMKKAREAGKRDVDFMKKAEGDEEKTRTTGENKMNKQTSRMKSFKTRRL